MEFETGIVWTTLDGRWLTWVNFVSTFTAVDCWRSDVAAMTSLPNTSSWSCFSWSEGSSIEKSISLDKYQIFGLTLQIWRINRSPELRNISEKYLLNSAFMKYLDISATFLFSPFVITFSRWFSWHSCLPKKCFAGTHGDIEVSDDERLSGREI